jgi:hypothetical protein
MISQTFDRFRLDNLIKKKKPKRLYCYSINRRNWLEMKNTNGTSGKVEGRSGYIHKTGFGNGAETGSINKKEKKKNQEASPKYVNSLSFYIMVFHQFSEFHVFLAFFTYRAPNKSLPTM